MGEGGRMRGDAVITVGEKEELGKEVIPLHEKTCITKPDCSNCVRARKREIPPTDGCRAIVRLTAPSPAAIIMSTPLGLYRCLGWMRKCSGRAVGWRT
jgi:hypothetical protein